MAQDVFLHPNQVEAMRRVGHLLDHEANALKRGHALTMLWPGPNWPFPLPTTLYLVGQMPVSGPRSAAPKFTQS